MPTHFDVFYDVRDLGYKVVRGASGCNGGLGFQLVPLFEASAVGSLDCVRQIVEAGFPADFNVAGENALSKAGSVEVVEYLFSQGVRPGATNFGFDAIDNAIEADNMPVLHYLLSRTDPITIQSKLLSASGFRMNPRAIRLILELGADPNKPDPDYGSPLNTASWQGNKNPALVKETIQVLIDAGADPNLLARGNRPLHEAVFGDEGSPAAVEALLSNGADPDALDEKGRTPLMVAADHGEFECARLLVEAGADQSIKDRFRESALNYALANLKAWQKPPFKFLNWGRDKIFRSVGVDPAEVSERSRVEAQKVVDLLSR